MGNLELCSAEASLFPMPHRSLRQSKPLLPCYSNCVKWYYHGTEWYIYL